MCENFSIDASSLTSYIKIKDYLLNELQPILASKSTNYICLYWY